MIKFFPSLLDTPRGFMVQFQDTVTPVMSAICDLHNYVLFYIIIIFMFGAFLIYDVLKFFRINKNISKFSSEGALKKGDKVINGKSFFSLFFNNLIHLIRKVSIFRFRKKSSISFGDLISNVFFFFEEKIYPPIDSFVDSFMGYLFSKSKIKHFFFIFFLLPFFFFVSFFIFIYLILYMKNHHMVIYFFLKYALISFYEIISFDSINYYNLSVYLDFTITHSYTYFYYLCFLWFIIFSKFLGFFITISFILTLFNWFLIDSKTLSFARSKFAWFVFLFFSIIIIIILRKIDTNITFIYQVVSERFDIVLTILNDFRLAEIRRNLLARQNLLADEIDELVDQALKNLVNNSDKQVRTFIKNLFILKNQAYKENFLPFEFANSPFGPKNRNINKFLYQFFNISPNTFNGVKTYNIKYLLLSPEDLLAYDEAVRGPRNLALYNCFMMESNQKEQIIADPNLSVEIQHKVNNFVDSLPQATKNRLLKDFDISQIYPNPSLEVLATKGVLHPSLSDQYTKNAIAQTLGFPDLVYKFKDCYVGTTRYAAINTLKKYNYVLTELDAARFEILEDAPMDSELRNCGLFLLTEEHKALLKSKFGDNIFFELNVFDVTDMFFKENRLVRLGISTNNRVFFIKNLGTLCCISDFKYLQYKHYDQIFTDYMNLLYKIKNNKIVLKPGITEIKTLDDLKKFDFNISRNAFVLPALRKYIPPHIDKLDDPFVNPSRADINLLALKRTRAAISYMVSQTHHSGADLLSVEDKQLLNLDIKGKDKKFKPIIFEFEQWLKNDVTPFKIITKYGAKVFTEYAHYVKFRISGIGNNGLTTCGESNVSKLQSQKLLEIKDFLDFFLASKRELIQTGPFEFKALPNYFSSDSRDWQNFDKDKEEFVKNFFNATNSVDLVLEEFEKVVQITHNYSRNYTYDEAFPSPDADFDSKDCIKRMAAVLKKELDKTMLEKVLSGPVEGFDVDVPIDFVDKLALSYYRTTSPKTPYFQALEAQLLHAIKNNLKDDLNFNLYLLSIADDIESKLPPRGHPRSNLNVDLIRDNDMTRDIHTYCIDCIMDTEINEVDPGVPVFRSDRQKKESIEDITNMSMKDIFLKKMNSLENMASKF